MLPLLSLLFFVISENYSPDCQRLGFEYQQLYEAVSLRPGDVSTARDYLKNYGNCISEEGASLILARNIPIIEELDCSEKNKLSRGELFFRSKKLCMRDVHFFPSRKFFAVNRVFKKIDLADGWQSISSADSTLFFDSSSKFEENQDENGEVLTKSEYDLYRNRLGKPMHPVFIFQNGAWKPALPLRESFALKTDDKNNFEIEIITEATLPYDSSELPRSVGLKAEEFQALPPAPGTYKIVGKNIRGVQLPQFEAKNSPHGSYHGIYRISLPDSTPASPKEISIKNSSFSIEIKHKNGRLETEIVVLVRSLAPDEISAIQSVITKEIPTFFVNKSL
ncbi:hypothetical protein J6Z39_07635 [bacterium]|nr:hypothetical protein [bacterium]